jgi:hypothetical protein
MTERALPIWRSCARRRRERRSPWEESPRALNMIFIIMVCGADFLAYVCALFLCELPFKQRLIAQAKLNVLQVITS